MLDDLRYAALRDLLGPTIEEAGTAEALSTLDVLAEAKFDSYERYPSLTGFWEELTGWLRQAAPGDRSGMLRWLAENLLFVSRDQVHSLLRVFAGEWLVTRSMELAVRHSCDLETELSGTAVCALSDGVPLGTTRRLIPNLTHRQFFSDPALLDGFESTLRHLVLIDDFSGTGKSLAHAPTDTEADEAPFGRVPDACRALRGLADPASRGAVVSVVLLMASAAAVRHLSAILPALGCSLHVTQVLNPCPQTAMQSWSRRYLGISPNPAVKTHVNADYRMGDLPVVLSHNTPNDTFALLWEARNSGDRTWRPLFPRFDRVREGGT
ncbi:hypothetical protein OG949_40715 (plasmid) [Streptomyces scopuliridis]|uniref:phosphoribosyltransferase-like protein n=1 Tax=Streptomyces scopuliridis TaxID=452529 RepID=UPI002DD7BC67|nr:hypothetical protein [Streptomyces scopuliridis]WSB39078.1 hypothetical protein OG949_40715 [Streptomyces scopuliridis]